MTNTAAPISIAELRSEGTSLIRHWVEIEETRTEVLRRLAEVVVSIRSQFFDNEGRRDWAGHSWDYRQFVSEMYAAAGVAPDSQENIQAALRYHVGNLLREVAPPDELAAVGLLPTSPRDRMATARAEIQAIAVALTEDLQSGDRKTRMARYGKLVDAAAVLTEKMAHFEVSEMPVGQARKALTEVEAAQERLGTLEKNLRHRIGR